MSHYNRDDGPPRGWDVLRHDPRPREVWGEPWEDEENEEGPSRAFLKKRFFEKEILPEYAEEYDLDYYDIEDPSDYYDDAMDWYDDTF